jgi:hypothetical protein
MKKNYLPYIFFFVLVVALFVTNYVPGTWLSGWDNLHPEFNFWLNIKRSLQAVWQEYQSLGLLGGMGHAADLPRQLFLGGVSLIIPTHLLRYFFHFFMLFVGAVGIYTLLKNVLLSQYDETIRTKGAILGGLFYIFNLGTIQYFFVPFEPYSTFWGLFPWEILTLFLFYKHPSKKTLLYLIAANIAAVPQGYVQTIFLVYLICVGLFMITEGITRRNKLFLNKSAKILLVIFCINSFWLLPNVYFVLKNVSVTQNAMQNRMATEKFFQMNKKHGTLADFPVLKEFYYDFLDADQNNQPDYMMKVWRNYFSSPFILTIGYLLFFITLYGLIQKNRYRLFLVVLFVFSAIIFLSDTFLIDLVNNLLRSIPIVNQVFRNPFTKFIVPTIFIFSVGFSLGTSSIMTRFSKKKLSLSLFLFVPFIVLLGIYTFPVWKGQLISPQMKVKIPNDYFKTFDYFKTQDKTARIMNLPQGSYWGWEVYQWGARGSGFLWYGIEQPILDRAFDVWSSDSENYYWQLNYALQKRDKNLFNSIIDKYQVQFILYDNSFSPSDNFNSKKVIIKQKDMLDYNPKVYLAKQYGSVYIYKTHLSVTPKQNVDLLKTVPAAQTNDTYMNIDENFLNLGYYTESKSPDFSSPFGSLFTNRFTDELPTKITENSSSYIFSSPLPKGNFALSLPSYSGVETNIATAISVKKQDNKMILQLSEQKPKVKVGKQYIHQNAITKEYAINLDQTVQFPLYVSINNRDSFKISSISNHYALVGTTMLAHAKDANTIYVYSSKEAVSQDLPAQSFLKPTICGIKKGNVEVNSSISRNSIDLKAKNTAICSVFGQPVTMKTDSLAKVSIDYRSTSDEYPQFCYFSQEKNGCLNNKDTIQTGFSNSGSTLSDTFQIPSSTNDQIYFNLILEAINDEDKDKLKEITYKNVSIQYFPLIASILVDTEQDSAQSVYISSPSPTTLSIEVPKLNNNFSYISPISHNIYKKDSLNYDTIMSTSSSIKEVKGSPKYLRTTAENASSSILLRRYDLSSGMAYLLSLKTKAVSGFPFTLNAFTSKDSRNYIYSYLPKNNNFSSDYYILPPIYEFDQGLNVLLSSTSFNEHASVNDLQDISINPIPYNYITGIGLKSNNTLDQASFSEPKEVKKSIYRYEVIPSSNEEGVVFLSQSYDPGWKAYVIDSSNFLQKVMPALFGKPLQHLKINGWANGWQIKEADSSSKIIIIYLPQYLEYLGFALLIIPFILLLRKSKLKSS